MNNNDFFDFREQAELLAKDLTAFCRKWGLQDKVAVCPGVKDCISMTMEAPLCWLLLDGKYEVLLNKLSEEAKDYIRLHDTEVADDAMCDAVDFLEQGGGWDPAEFDSYEEYLELKQYDEPDYAEMGCKDAQADFASREEYETFLERALAGKEDALQRWFVEKSDIRKYSDTYYDDGEIAGHVMAEFNAVFARYGFEYVFDEEETLIVHRKGMKNQRRGWI